MTNADLADRARQVARSYPGRTPGRRAAAACWVALTTTKTPAAARKALGTFGDPVTHAAAAVILEREGER